MKKLLVVAGIVAMCCAGSDSKANPSLQLSSPDTLTGLYVGDVVTVDVSLAALQPGEELVSLTGCVLFPGMILGTPLSVNPGSIVPDAADFFQVAFTGQADGTFLTFSIDSADHITQNGVFYSFDVQAQDVGSGEFAFDPLALIAEEYDPTSLFLPILREVDAGPSLPFRVTAIPAPPSLALALLGLAAVRRNRQRLC